MTPVWQSPPPTVTLERDQIHLWRRELTSEPEQRERFLGILSPDEKAKCDRFKFSRHRHHSLISRGSLRELLSQYLDLAPAEIQFEYSDKGKPQILPAQNPSQIQFNLSHSQDWVVYGITRQAPIGVDLEYRKSMTDLEKLAHRFFTPSEAQALQTLSPADKQSLFFQIWTAKEAFLKCTGAGITGGLDTLETKIDQAQVIGLSSHPHFYFFPFQLEPSYQGALVVATANPCPVSQYLRVG